MDPVSPQATLSVEAAAALAAAEFSGEQAPEESAQQREAERLRIQQRGSASRPLFREGFSSDDAGDLPYGTTVISSSTVCSSGSGHGSSAGLGGSAAFPGRLGGNNSAYYSFTLPHVVSLSDLDAEAGAEDGGSSDVEASWIQDTGRSPQKGRPSQFRSSGFVVVPDAPERRDPTSIVNFVRPVEVGERLPSSPIIYRGRTIDVQDSFSANVGIVFGVIGAFNPICSEMHIPGFVDLVPEFRALQVDPIVCIAVNDPFVLRAWKKALDGAEGITLLCDATGALTRRLGLLEDYTSSGLGLRCRRFALIVGPRAVVRWVGLDDEAFAPVVRKQLEQVLAQELTTADLLRDDEAHMAIKRAQCDEFFPDGEPVTNVAAALSDSDDRVRSPMSLAAARSIIDEMPSDDVFSQNFEIRTIRSPGRILQDVGSHQGNENEDIQFGYVARPSGFVIQRSQFTASGGQIPLDPTGESATTVAQPQVFQGWTINIHSKDGSWGYAVVDRKRFFARELQVHSPARHGLKGGSEMRPFEMYIIHAPRIREGESLDRLVIVCLSFSWEPETLDATCTFMESLMEAILPQQRGGRPERRLGEPIETTYEECPLNLQLLIAENTISTFYRFSTHEGSDFVRRLTNTVEADVPADLPVTWFVARDAIALSLEGYQNLQVLFGHSPTEKLGAVGGKRALFGVHRKRQQTAFVRPVVLEQPSPVRQASDDESTASLVEPQQGTDDDGDYGTSICEAVLAAEGSEGSLEPSESRRPAFPVLKRSTSGAAEYKRAATSAARASQSLKLSKRLTRSERYTPVSLVVSSLLYTFSA